jgi:hypothetical protein
MKPHDHEAIPEFLCRQCHPELDRQKKKKKETPPPPECEPVEW